jgi:hypothetical protein
MSQRPLFQFAKVEAPRRPSPERRRRERHDDHRSRDIETGKAAEHLVCCDLLLKGYNAFLSDQGLPYDIIVDLGSRILRVQVKGTRQPKNPMPGHRLSDGYFFNVRRAGKRGTRIYGDNEFDMYALVALDIHAIAYYAKDDLDIQCVSLRVPGIQYHHDSRAVRRFEHADFARALASVLENSRRALPP